MQEYLVSLVTSVLCLPFLIDLSFTKSPLTIWILCNFCILGFDDDKEVLMSQMNFEKKFGQSAIFVTSTLMVEGGVPPSSSPAALLKEAIHVISCGYEDKTEWGLEVLNQPYCQISDEGDFEHKIFLLPLTTSSYITFTSL